jgi:hypothetical protein
MRRRMHAFLAIIRYISSVGSVGFPLNVSVFYIDIWILLGIRACVCMSYEEEDTCMPSEEEDTCMSGIRACVCMFLA